MFQRTVSISHILLKLALVKPVTSIIIYQILGIPKTQTTVFVSQLVTDSVTENKWKALVLVELLESQAAKGMKESEMLLEWREN